MINVKMYKLNPWCEQNKCAHFLINAVYIGVYQRCIYQNDLIYTPSIYTTFMNFKDMPHDPFKFSSEIFRFHSKTRGGHILEKK